MTQPRREWGFYLGLGLLGSFYVVLLIALLLVDIGTLTPSKVWEVWQQPVVRSALLLSLVSSVISAVLSIVVAVPLGYLLARTRFWGRPILDFLCDVPFVLPPLVIGLSLLLLFQTSIGRAIQKVIPITYAVPAVVLAQFVISAALAVRLLRGTFSQLNPRTENVARVLGCTRWQAFVRITLPEARTGILSAFTLAWARALGEFGPVLIFAGITRHKTEVLPTTIYLELSVGHLDSAVAVSVLMILVSAFVLLLVRRCER
jgi:molybdate transport system permease protein